MCKIMAIAGIKPEKSDVLYKWVRAASQVMTKHDKDGFGYAAVNENGMFGERWINPKHAFQYRAAGYGIAEAMFAKALSEISGSPLTYNSFGSVPQHKNKKNLFKGTCAIMLHARAATNGTVSIQNTHPFVADDTALIHNGVIANQERLVNITSECDSECILNEYIEDAVALNPNNIQKTADTLSGWYAVAALTTDRSGEYVLDIFKDSSTSLVWSYIAELEAVVFCTTELILREICRNVGFKIGVIHPVLPERFLRLNTRTGEPKELFAFKANADRWAYNEREWETEEYWAAHGTSNKNFGRADGTDWRNAAPIEHGGHGPETVQSQANDGEVEPEPRILMVNEVNNNVEPKRMSAYDIRNMRDALIDKQVEDMDVEEYGEEVDRLIAQSVLIARGRKGNR